jgi:coenzyme F420-reducing hydrogenase beta subunit
MCIGCGTCAVASNGAIRMTVGSLGCYEAGLGDASPAQIASASRVCPFSDAASNEDAIAAKRFPDLPADPNLGRHAAILAGRIRDEGLLWGASSGGLLTLVLELLLDNAIVDGVIHVGASPQGPLFRYRISTSTEEIRSSRKSAYYATTMADCLEAVRATDKRYAIVGVPCFIRAARLLAEESPDVADRLAYFLGIVCGHMKSHFYAESLAWQAGLAPQELAAIDFRVKKQQAPAYSYDYVVRSRSGIVRSASVLDAIDSDWGFAAFQPEACNYCDDVFAETADAVFGDAWLPQYADDSRGTSLVVVRDETILHLLVQAGADRALLQDLTPAQATQSQAGGIRHRRDGLRVRLADDLAAGLSVPVKRVTPGYSGLSRLRVALFRQRRAMSRLSQEWFQQAREQRDLELYRRQMLAAIDRYRRIEAAQRGPWSSAGYLARAILGRARSRLAGPKRP